MDRQSFFSLVDSLALEDLDVLYEHIKERRHALLQEREDRSRSLLSDVTHEPTENIRAEVNAFINETIDTVKRKRKTQELAKQGE